MSDSRIRNLALIALLAGSVISQAASASWLHYANVVVQASSAKARHIGSKTIEAVAATSIPNPTVCASYESNHPKGKRGRLLSTVRIDRADGSFETLAMKARVRNNLALDCRTLSTTIAAGDRVTFDLTFKGFPKQQLSATRSDFFSVNGIVSSIGAPGPRAIPPGVNPPDTGGHIYASMSVFAADRDRQKHPRKLTQALVMDSDAQTPFICSALGNVAAKANAGRILTKLRILHQDGTTTRMSFNGKVVDNIYAECQFGPALVAGDVLVFKYRFKRLPKLTVGGGFFDTSAIYGVVSPDGPPVVRAGQ